MFDMCNVYGTGPDQAQIEEALRHGLPVWSVHLQGSHQRYAAPTQEKLSQSQRFLPGIYIFSTDAAHCPFYETFIF